MRLALLGIGLLAASCGVLPPKPEPPKPPVPTVRTVAVVANAPTGTAYLDDTGGGKSCELVEYYCEVVVHNYPELQQTYLTVKAEGYQPYRADAVTLPAGNVQLWLGPGCGMDDPDQCVHLPPLALTRIDLPRITAGARFFAVGGQPTFLNGISDFQLFARFINGEDITPRLSSTARFLGPEHTLVHRVWLMADTGFSDGSAFHFRPQDYPNYFAQLRAFAQALALKGHYAKLTLFVNTGRVMPSASDQQIFIKNVAEVMRDEPNLICSAGNEYEQDANAWAHNLHWPDWLTCSAGSGGSQIWPDEQFGFPHLQFEEYHVFADQWQRKASHEAMEMANTNGLTVFTTEMTRPDQDGYPTRYRGAAATCKLLAGGCLYHSASGRLSVPIPANEEPYVAEWLAGLASVPLACQPGGYIRRDDLITPQSPPGTGVLRAYERRTGNPNCVATTPW